MGGATGREVVRNRISGNYGWPLLFWSVSQYLDGVRAALEELFSHFSNKSDGHCFVFLLTETATRPPPHNASISVGRSPQKKVHKKMHNCPQTDTSESSRRWSDLIQHSANWPRP